VFPRANRKVGHVRARAVAIRYGMIQPEDMLMERNTIRINVLPELRARAAECAKLEGSALPEFV